MGSGTSSYQPVTKSPDQQESPGLQRFYAARKRLSTGLLFFVIVVGLPIVAVPALRNRLSERVLALRAAMSGDIAPAMARVGANQEAFPKEYENPEPALPILPVSPRNPVPALSARAGMRGAQKVLKLPPGPPPTLQNGSSSEKTDARAAAGSEDLGIIFQQGNAEKDAYALLLKSNATIEGMVKGSNPSLHFKSWDAADRGDDTYWVRLKFQSENGQDLEFIWEVKPKMNKVAPLSYNARTLS